MANCLKVLESQQELEQASTHQDLDVEWSVLRVAHMSELDTVDAII